MVQMEWIQKDERLPTVFTSFLQGIEIEESLKWFNERTPNW